MKFQFLKTAAFPAVLTLLTSITIPGRSEGGWSGSDPIQSRFSYEAAIQNRSTSPSYVRISITDGRTALVKPVCTMANFLLGAIAYEYGPANGTANWSKAAEIALRSADHTFRFETQAALDNIHVRYSEDELSAARALLVPLSTDDLKAEFSSHHSAWRLDTNGYARDAIACVLIERGLSPRLGDISGQVYVDEWTGTPPTSALGPAIR